MRTITGAAIAAVLLLAAGPAAPARAGSPPAPPGNLHTVSVTQTDIVLAWSPSAGAVNYALFFDDNPAPFLTSAATSFDVHLNRAIGMIPCSTHTFRVRAENAAGERSFSNPLTASFAPGDNTPPTAPRNLRVLSRSGAGVTLAWDPSTDASSFDYLVSGAPCGGLTVSEAATQVLVPSVAADPVCGLPPGATATFTVRARDAFDNVSAPSNALTVAF